MHQVTCLADLSEADVVALLATLGVRLQRIGDDEVIPASYWGAPEAGVIGDCLYARGDTPVHSILHTACHVLCMSEERRARLHTDCGGTDLEEAAVCYLQCLLADAIPGYDRNRLFADMDAWGYSFRLGSAQAWFKYDAEDARAHLAGLQLSPALRALVNQTRSDLLTAAD
ncbi:hypothetical protein [Algiphilus sp.]|uniref:hypothetical protein n=1 Tax=Algiphilus sp. TaxID=1872431 RepID=UPI003B517CA2